jgi:hypothetical protein
MEGGKRRGRKEDLEELRKGGTLEEGRWEGRKEKEGRVRKEGRKVGRKEG